MFKTRFYLIVLVVAAAQVAHAQLPILSSTDAILAIDTDGLIPLSSYPGAEAPMFALDQDASTKYLNFAAAGSGIIVTPAFGASAVQSMMFTTAGDAPERDPAAFELWGTNETIMSTDNSYGDAEAWTMINSGMVALPDLRMTDGPLLSFANTDSYASYRVIFPELKNGGAANSMQVADIRMFEAMDGTGASILSTSDAALAMSTNDAFNSSYPDGEAPMFALDGDAGTKYLNFGNVNSGFIVTPNGPNADELITAIQMTTGGDAPERDPANWELFGTNDAIVSADNSAGDGENWTLVDSGSVDLPLDRGAVGDMVPVNATEAFDSYRLVFTGLRDNGNGIMQVADVQFFAVPEPSAFLISLLGLGCLGLLRKN